MVALDNGCNAFVSVSDGFDALELPAEGVNVVGDECKEDAGHGVLSKALDCRKHLCLVEVGTLEVDPAKSVDLEIE
jgi:hypothetical protein